MWCSLPPSDWLQNTLAYYRFHEKGIWSHLLIKISLHSAFKSLQTAKERAEDYNFEYPFLVGAFFLFVWLNSCLKHRIEPREHNVIAMLMWKYIIRISDVSVFEQNDKTAYQFEVWSHEYGTLFRKIYSIVLAASWICWFLA